MLFERGDLSVNAASYLMKLLYGSRISWPWILVAIQRLTQCLDTPKATRWSADCDRRLVRIYSFIDSHLDDVIAGSLSEKDADTCELWFWPDADLAGDPLTTTSTNGMFLEIVGGINNDFTAAERSVPVSWGCKKTTGTALHTQEAEICSIGNYLKSEAIPAQLLLSLALGRPVTLRIKEDNDAAIVAAKKGYSPSLRSRRLTLASSMNAST